MIGSSSKGNCYILDNGDEALVLEAGIRFREVMAALGFNLRKVVGCLVTHRHNDHAKHIREMVDNGFHVLALQDVWSAKGVWGSRTKSIELGKGYKFGGFKVLPFPAAHDVPCVGYLITHEACGRLMFLTDSCSCGYRFNGLNHVLIECNYSERDLVEAINAGRTALSQRERLLNSHMELNTCKGFLTDSDLADVQEIVLLHLSGNNSDERRFVSEIERLTGKVVYAANPGLVINIDRI